MNYRVSDIITGAKQIADIENSSFISFNENIRLINECWTNLYQKLINKNDLSFVQTIDLDTGHNILPDDFYQVQSITDLFGQPIAKYTVGMTPGNVYYKIINNSIYVNNIDNVKMVYYPKPLFLTYTNDDIKYDFTYGIDEKILAVNNPYLLTNKALYNLSNNEIVYNDISDLNTPKTLLKDGTIINDAIPVVENGNVITYCYYFPENNKLLFNDTEYFISGALSISIESGYPCHILKQGEDYRFWNGDYWRTMTFTYYDHRNACLLKTDNETPAFYFEQDGHCLYLKKDVSIDAYIDDICLGSIIAKHVTPIAINMNTGYGLLTVGSSKVSIKSITPDTLLEVPSYLYYNVIVYMLAQAYCVKQGKDVSQINMLLSQHLETLYDTLTNDAFSVSKITNIYKGR